MCYLSLLLQVQIVYYLYSRDCLASRDTTVAFCVWLLENYFRRVLVDGSLFISRCCSFFSAKDGCGQGKFCVLLLCNFSRLRHKAKPDAGEEGASAKPTANSEQRTGRRSLTGSRMSMPSLEL